MTVEAAQVRAFLGHGKATLGGGDPPRCVKESVWSIADLGLTLRPHSWPAHCLRTRGLGAELTDMSRMRCLL